MSTMRWVVVFGVACSLSADAFADDKGGDAKKLEGTWYLKSATRDGKPVDDMKDGQVVIAGDRFTIKPKEGKGQEFTFKVDSSKKPKVLDMALVENVPNASPGLVIYELDGDNLKMAIGPPDKRPTAFNDKGQALITLVRKK